MPRSQGWLARLLGLEPRTPVVAQQPIASPLSDRDAIAVARDSMTPGTRDNIDASWLGRRIGNTTFAEANNAQVRFRIGDFERGHWQLLPDTERARLLLGSPSAPRLQDAIDGALEALKGHSTFRVRGIALPHDQAGVVAADIVALTDAKASARNLTPAGQRSAITESLRETIEMDGVNSGYNYHDWIVTMPDHARALLASVGAYRPVKGEESHADPAGWAEFLPQFLRHETEHTVTPNNSADPRVDWLEEGIAESLATAKPADRQTMPAFNWAGKGGYGSVDDASARATQGWKGYPRASQSVDEAADASNQLYFDREDTITELLGMAGVDPDTAPGYKRARMLLQRKPAADVPKVLAAAIGEHHGLGVGKQQRIASLILNVEDRAGAMEQIRTIVGPGA